MLYRGADAPERGPWDAWTAAGGAGRPRPSASRSARWSRAWASTRPVSSPGRRRPSTRSAAAASCSPSAPAGTSPSSGPSASRSIPRLTARFEESFEIIRRLMAGERVTFAGRVLAGRGCRAAAAAAAPARASDGGSERAAHAGRDAPARRHLEHLVLRLRQHRRGLCGAQRRDQHPRRARGPRPRPRSSAARARSSCSTAGRASGPTRGPPHRRAAAPASPRRLRALAQAGADEAILVVDPITERSARQLGDVLAALDA